MQKSLGIAPIPIHALRHTFASNLINAGVDIKVVSQLLGHSSVKITYDTYVHTDLSRPHKIRIHQKKNHISVILF